jgi:hypothetical protein
MKRAPRTWLPRIAGAAGALAFACIMHAVGCGDSGTYLLVGRFYLERRDCLGTSSTIDAIGGDGPNACAPTCLVQKAYDGGTGVYVTNTCGPYPPDLDASGSDPRCAKALAALQRNDTCQPDGTSTRPLPRDAGSD